MLRPNARAVRGFFAAFLTLACFGTAKAQPTSDYAHIIVIVEENKDADMVLNPDTAPNLARLAKTYGVATNFFGEVHPSEGNYVAMLAGDTFGIHDDDAFFCTPGTTDHECPNAQRTDYPAHTLLARHLGDQLADKGLKWKGYYGSLPEPGSLAVHAPDPRLPFGAKLDNLYASKHSGFINFKDVQTAPDRAKKLVDLDQLDRDLAADALPAFALVVPNQCDEMHGLHGADTPEDCDITHPLLTVKRGDRVIGELVAKLQASKAWKSKRNMAIVITFDESGSFKRDGCCAVTPTASSNFGGGHIATVVITNHGPRGLSDPTPYNHYSLLRTFEDLFHIEEHLGHAADTDKGVTPMTALFATH